MSSINAPLALQPSTYPGFGNSCAGAARQKRSSPIRALRAATPSLTAAAISSSSGRFCWGASRKSPSKAKCRLSWGWPGSAPRRGPFPGLVDAGEQGRHHHQGGWGMPSAIPIWAKKRACAGAPRPEQADGYLAGGNCAETAAATTTAPVMPAPGQGQE